MTADLKASTYLVDGVDLQASGVDLLHDGSGLWSGIAETISVATAAGADGGMITGGVLPTRTHSTMFEVTAADAQAVWASVVALRRRCKPRRTITLTRRMPDPDGTDANTDHTTTGRMQGDPRVAWIEKNNRAQVDIDWLISGGPWFGASEAIAAVGAVTVKGDLPTRAITATLAAGAVDPVVTNTSTGNGYSFRYIGTVPAGGVLVDVRTRKATGITGSVDLSLNLRWSKDDPFQLDPGAQTLTISSGSASFTYLPAYA
jgi:hypothetical protein